MRNTIYLFARLHLENRSKKRDDDYNFLLNVLTNYYKKHISKILDIVLKCVMDFKLNGEIVRYK